MKKLYTLVFAVASFAVMAFASHKNMSYIMDNQVVGEASSRCEDIEGVCYDGDYDSDSEVPEYSILNGYVISDNVNIRQNPDINSPVLGKLHKYESLGVNALNNGAIQNLDGWTNVLYIIDGNDPIQGWVATKFLRMFDVDAPDCKIFNGEPRELLGADNDPIFGMLTLECVGDKLKGEMWIKNKDMIESGGNGILMWIELAGHFFYGTPVINAVGEENDRIWGDMLRNPVAYDSANDILMVGGYLWK